MEETITSQFNFTEALKPLEEQLRSGNPDFKEFQKAYFALRDAQRKLQDFLEYAVNLNPNNREAENLYRRISGDNVSDLMDRLKGYGFRLRNEGMKDDFDKMAYRLLELTRSGKRHDVYYGLLRLFMANQKEFAAILLEPFKPIYSENLFKVMVFAFLSGALGE